MKNYSAKSFLSFFICLVICIPHSSYSLSTSHILRKRMDFAVGARNVAEAGDVGKSTIGQADRLGATATNGVRSSSGSSEFLKVKPSTVDPGTLPLNHESSMRPSWWEGVALIFARFQRALSEIPQTLRNFFRTQVQIDRFFDRTPGIWKLVQDKGSIDEKVDSFMEKNGINFLPAGQEGKIHSTHDEANKVKELKESLHKLNSIQREDIRTYARVAKTHTDFSAKIKPMLMRSWLHRFDLRLRVEDPEFEDEPMKILARKMAPLQSKSLAEDKKILSKLLPQDQRYLSAILGNMGPEQVLEPWFKAVVREKVESNELTFKQGEEVFITRLQIMQKFLAGLARFHRTSDLSTLSEEGKETLNGYNHAIVELEKRLSEAFGGREKFKTSLKMIESMDFHKRFMMELESPSEFYPYYLQYDLQFLEPFRYLGEEIKEEDKLRIGKQLGIQIEENDIFTIKNHASTALSNFQAGLDVILRIREEEMKLMKIISPDQLKSLANYQIPVEFPKVVEDAKLAEDSKSVGNANLAENANLGKAE